MNTASGSTEVFYSTGRFDSGVGEAVGLLPFNIACGSETWRGTPLLSCSLLFLAGRGALSKRINHLLEFHSARAHH